MSNQNCKSLTTILSFGTGFLGGQDQKGKAAININSLDSLDIDKVVLAPPSNNNQINDQQHGNDLACQIIIQHALGELILDGFISWQKKEKGQTDYIGVTLSGQQEKNIGAEFEELFGRNVGTGKGLASIALPLPGNKQYRDGQDIKGSADTPTCAELAAEGNVASEVTKKDPSVTKIVGRNIVEAPKRELQYTVTLSEKAKEEFELPFEILTSETEINAIPLSTPLGDEENGYEYDYLDGISNVGLTDNVTNNGDGTITVPAGVKTFSAFIPVQPDDIVEPAEITILQVGDQQGQAYIFDNWKNYNVESIEGQTVSEGATNGEANRIDFTVKLNRPLQSGRRFSYFFGNQQETDDQDYAIAGINEVKSIDYLVGESNITIEGVNAKDVVPDPGTQTIRLKKGVQEFTISVPVVDD